MTGALTRACLLGVILLVTSCASYTDDTAGLRSAFRSGSYGAALKDLDASGLKESSKDRLLYQLEKASILDRMGERKKSRQALLDADRIVDELYTTRISKVAASFVVNDASAEYAGEDYEKVAIHTMLALSFLEDRDYEGAAVEARRINSKLQEINQAHGDQKNRYAEDAFARYLSAVIHEFTGNPDSAIIDYRAIIELSTSREAGFLFGGSPPESAVRALWKLYTLRGRQDEARRLAKDHPKATSEEKQALGATGELVVFHEVGHIAIKVSEDIVLGLGDQIVRFSWPVIRDDSHSGYGFSGVQIGGARTRADEIENLNVIAQSNLEDRRTRMMVKSSARLIAKATMNKWVEEQFGPLAGLAMNIVNASTETADTRSWTLLPRSFSVTRLRLPPGAHAIEIYNNGRLSRMEDVEIKAGRMVILRSAG